MQKSQKTKFKVWDTHYDFSEINKFNYHEVFKTYFKLTTKKITLMAMLLVLIVIFQLISHFALSLMPIASFLTFNITIWIIMVAFLAFNFFYSFILLEISILFRLILNPANLPGVIAMNLNDFTFLLFLFLIIQLVNYSRFQFQKNYDQKTKRTSYFWSLIVAMILATIVTSGIDVGYNYGFMIDFYGDFLSTDFSEFKQPWALITIFWFNLAQGAINVAIFITLYKAAYLLVNNYID